MGQYTSLAPNTAEIIHGLAKLAPKRLAIMHGSSFEGDGATALTGLANYYATSLESSRRD
jgi:hypothetical protein